MGWTSYHTDLSSKDEIIQALSRDNYKVLKIASAAGVYYAAVEHPITHKVFGYVALVNRKNNVYNNFCIKEMDETVGPVYCDCPASILDLLSPTGSEWANNWRNKCRARAGIMRMKDMKVGYSFRLKEPLRYSGYGDCYNFVCAKAKWTGKKTYFIKVTAAGGGNYYCAISSQRHVLNREVDSFTKTDLTEICSTLLGI